MNVGKLRQEKQKEKENDKKEKKDDMKKGRIKMTELKIGKEEWIKEEQ